MTDDTDLTCEQYWKNVRFLLKQADKKDNLADNAIEFLEDVIEKCEEAYKRLEDGFIPVRLTFKQHRWLKGLGSTHEQYF